jgi:asparagine synthase (glutamine-hydrolysing)
MCGFVGIIGGNPQSKDIESMLDRIRHRGPDGQGFYLADGVGLGHVRLAIVELSTAGHQPMKSPDGRYTLVYNGEIYNHLELRSQLEADGVRFRGHSDTETLLWLLIRNGKGILHKLNGIFAFAFYDSHEKSLLLARDPMGVKPLYYGPGKDGRFLFASEIKALFATGEIEPRLNVEDILELFMFHFISGERTAFASVMELLPGHLLECSDGSIRVEAFWSVLSSARNGTEGENGGQPLAGVLRSAVQRQLMADVPLGIMSSGGLDSAIVTACAGRRDAPMMGFCFTDPDRGYDELKFAKLASEPFGVELREVRIKESDVPDMLTRLTWQYDEPIPRPHHLAAYAVANAAREAGLKVLLTGEGGDELFGGYGRYLEIAEEAARSGDDSGIVFGHNRVALERIARFWPGDRFNNPFRFDCAEETRGLDVINRQLIQDQRTFLQHFLQRSDRMGMAASLELRVPLLDIPLVEFVNRRPGSDKVQNGKSKRMLIEAAQGLVPDVLLNRPKQPFDMPMASFLRKGPVSELINQLLLTNPRCGGIFDAKGMAETVVDFRAGRDELWKIVWLLLATEIWMRAFKVSV